jgi:4-hydroxymandelate synthase
MNISGIDHVEFYVDDAQRAAASMCDEFGFRLCGRSASDSSAGDHRSLLLRQGDVHILLTSGLSPTHPATGYVRRHGDGVAVLALGTTDARAAYEEALARGAVPVEPPTIHERGAARVVTAAVGGFGDVSHRFVERHGTDDGFFPAAPEMVTTGDEDASQLFTVVDHAAVCLLPGDLDPTVRYYEEVFGFRQIFEEFIEVGDQAMNSKVVQSPSGQVTFTLIEPVPGRRPGQIDGFLARHDGAGVQHLALLTDDIVGAVRTLQDRGVRFLGTPDSYYDELEQRLGRTDLKAQELRDVNVLVDRDHWGQVFQIFTQSTHPRRTYFTEVIDRHGARTFGSGNIKALYEAVEREKAAATG